MSELTLFYSGFSGDLEIKTKLSKSGDILVSLGDVVYILAKENSLSGLESRCTPLTMKFAGNPFRTLATCQSRKLRRQKFEKVRSPLAKKQPRRRKGFLISKSSAWPIRVGSAQAVDVAQQACQITVI